MNHINIKIQKIIRTNIQIQNCKDCRNCYRKDKKKRYKDVIYY